MTRARASRCVCAAICLAAPASASAASVTDGPAGPLFTAGAGERNNVTVSEDGQGRLLLRDRGARLVARAGCKQLGRHRARCRRPALGASLEVKLRNRDDRFLAKTGYRVSVRGGSGRDRIRGGFGQDTLFGGPDDDVVRGRGGNDAVIGSGSGNHRDGDDTLRGGDGDDSLSGGKGDDDLEGRDGNDALGGNTGKDFLKGGDGDDSFDGGKGDDTLEGRDGNDRLFGRGNDDRIRGGRGDDTLYGNHGRDRLQGRDGNDRLNGGDDRDLVRGGDGNDRAAGADDGDTVQGRAGDDVLSGGAGKDLVEGHQGNDVVNGGDDADDLNGGEGDDLHIARDDPNTEPGTPGGHHDRITCGRETDVARTDANDTVIPDCETIPLWDDALAVAPFPTAIDHDGDTMTLHAACSAPDGCRGTIRVEGTEGEDFAADGEFNLAPQTDGDAPAVVTLTMRGDDELLRDGLRVRVAADPAADMELPGGTGGYRGVFEG